MIQRLALLLMAATLACSGERPQRADELPTAAGSFAPKLSRTGDRVVLSWVERDASGAFVLRYAYREGQGWSAPRDAIHDPKLVADTADVPAVVPLHDGSLAAHWTVDREGATDARDLLVAVSRDGGTSWTRPVRPHTDMSESEHGMAALVPAVGGGFGMCWLDGRAGALSEYGEGGTGLYWADWAGDAFGPETQLDPRVCDCCKTAAAPGPAGPIVAYRDRDTAEKRDISFVSQSASAWTSARAVHGDGWTLSACPVNGPAIAAHDKTVAIAWFTGAGAAPSVLAALSADGAATLGPPVRIDGGAPVGRVDATVLDDGSTVVVWLERKGERAEVRARRLGADGTLTPHVVVAETSPSRASGYPVIAADSGRAVLVAWTEAGTPGRVRATSLTLP